MTVYAQLVEYASHQPSKRVENAFFEQHLDTSDQWIKERSGIQERYFCDKSEDELTLAVKVAEDVLSSSQTDPADIDLAIVATSTSSMAMPSLACRLQGEMGLGGFAFDVNAACSGFLVAMMTAQRYIESGAASNVLVVAVDVASRHLDMSDRSTCILFGDGAGAAILRASSQPGVLHSYCGSDGHSDLIYTEKYSESGYIRMKGREVFRDAIAKFQLIIDHMHAHTQFKISDFDLIIPHQANERIIKRIAKDSKIDEEKVVCSMSHTGNTMAASIPLAMTYAKENKLLKPGMLVMLESYGAGIIWSYVVIKI